MDSDRSKSIFEQVKAVVGMCGKVLRDHPTEVSSKIFSLKLMIEEGIHSQIKCCNTGIEYHSASKTSLFTRGLRPSDL